MRNLILLASILSLVALAGYSGGGYTTANGGATVSGLTASKALISYSSGVLATSAVTSTELGYVAGVTSAIQTQMDTKAAKGANSDITSMTGVTAINRTGGTAITGTNTNDAASAGQVGELICCSTASISAGASNTFVNVCNLTLTAGDWSMSAQLLQFNNGGSNVTTVDMGISTDSTAATFTNPSKTLGDNWFEVSMAAGTTNVTTQTITHFRQSLTGSTVYYFKGSATYSVAAPKFAGRMCGLRVR